MFCCFFAGCLKIIAPGVGFWHDFSATGVRVFALSLCPGVENPPFQKNSSGVCPGAGGRMARLGID